ncbi:MAG: methyltransferase domain-containing protein [Pseudomonadota bacterium]
MSAQLKLDQFAYRDVLDALAKSMQGPALQIGSREQVIDQKVEGRKTWRDRLEGRPFIGADMEDGQNVDAVFDITWPLEKIQAALPDTKTFRTIICAHVLEHVTDPPAAARNLTALLEPGGTLFIQVPWVQGFHAFPDDYWRISLSGLGVLFPDLKPRDWFYSGGSSDVAYRITRAGLVAFDVQARQVEAQLFQVMFPADQNRKMLAQAKGPQYLSRAYLPAMVIGWVARKPRPADH